MSLSVVSACFSWCPMQIRKRFLVPDANKEKANKENSLQIFPQAVLFPIPCQIPGFHQEFCWRLHCQCQISSNSEVNNSHNHLCCCKLYIWRTIPGCSHQVQRPQRPIPPWYIWVKFHLSEFTEFTKIWIHLRPSKAWNRNSTRIATKKFTHIVYRNDEVCNCNTTCFAKRSYIFTFHERTVYTFGINSQSIEDA